MELKHAASICLIALFSAALVVLIARALDMQAASRIEVKLDEIVKELHALRKATGAPSEAGDPAAGPGVEDGLMVYYFHGAARCPTCRAIERQTYETVQADFADQVEKEEVVWEVVNYDQPAGRALADKFQVATPMVVLVRMKGGQIERWNRLDQVWVLVSEKDAFAKYIRDSIREMLKVQPEEPAEDMSAIPVPGGAGGE